MDKGIIKKGATDRTTLIDTVISIIENKLGAAQNEMFRAVIDSVFDGMDRDGDRIKNTLKNRRLLVLVDNVFTDFAKGKGLEVGATVISGVTKVINYNEKYFSLFTKPAELAPLQETTINTLSDWLGITDKGLLKPNGYLETLINDPRIRNQVKDITLKTVVNQSGFFETKKVLRQYLTDTEENGGAGALRKYYRNFVYDTISTVDRTASKLTADKLKLNYAIYEGGLIKTSRKFCITHNGKVYSREEIADFDPKEAKPPGYNPFTDLGGYACRHHLNWIPDAVAFAMRPELRLKPVPKKPEAAAVKPPEVVKPFTGDRQQTAKDLTASFEKAGYKVKSVEFHKDMTKEQVNRYSKQVDKLLTEYDTVRIGKDQNPVIKFSSGGGTFGYVAPALYGESLREINFGHRTDAGRADAARVTNYDWKYSGRQDRNFAAKSKVDPENLDIATVTHEFAHVISLEVQAQAFKPYDDRLEPFWTELASIKRRYSTEVGKYLKYGAKGTFEENTNKLNEIYLGDYASTKLVEFMAETFTEYKLKSNPSKYAKEAGKLIDKYFKRKK